MQSGPDTQAGTRRQTDKRVLSAEMCQAQGSPSKNDGPSFLPSPPSLPGHPDDRLKGHQLVKGTALPWALFL